MLLESIRLENFRQFKKAEINFASGDDGRNVTIIMGENGTGKTTFAQAFSWCLYGKTSFTNKVLLNSSVADEMLPGDVEEVKVELSLKHGLCQYRIIRKLKYRKNHTGLSELGAVELNIQKKSENGNTDFLRPTQLEASIRNILPAELMKYFFFDGERVKKLSDEVGSGKKATEFSDAVKGLLGLDGFQSAIDHFNPNRKNSVISKYENAFDASGNNQIDLIKQRINQIRDKISEKEKERDQIEDEKNIAIETEKKKREEIQEYQEGARKQEEKDKINRNINSLKTDLNKAYKLFSSEFSKNFYSFSLQRMIADAISMLSKGNFDGVDIPYMHQKTIEYLLKKGVCVCGTHLTEGSLAYNKVKELIDFLPPKSIGTLISDFKKNSKKRLSDDNELDKSLRSTYGYIQDKIEEIQIKENEFNDLKTADSTENSKEKYEEILSLIDRCNATIKKCDKWRDDNIACIGGLNNELQSKQKELGKLSLLDQRNVQNQKYLAYARRIFSDLKKKYEESEEEIRASLQRNINDIFKNIFDGDFYINIDSKYHLSVSVQNHSGEVETSTAQSISVIFAFITAIIKMAKENKETKEQEMLSSEPYPLVMDAPLSTFDSKRIKAVCESLPKVAEQVIIFIKDTDGDIAREHLASKIGKEHMFVKESEFLTVIREAGNV